MVTKFMGFVMMTVCAVMMTIMMIDCLIDIGQERAVEVVAKEFIMLGGWLLAFMAYREYKKEIDR